MTAIFMDANIADADRRKRLYAGDIFVFSPTPGTLALCDFARQMIEDAFAADPLHAQYRMPVEEFVTIFGPLKPKFIHHPDTKKLIQQVLLDTGCDLHETYLDVPRLRGVTSDGYLTSGVGYAHHPHRDTWFSAPMCQLNWWLPIYDIESESSMDFHPRYWSEPVENDSHTFNYFEWNSTGRKNAAQNIKSDTRKQPHATRPIDLEPAFRFVGRPGSIIIFSGAQVHSTVPNTSGRTRFSIDFRSVNIADVIAQEGAPNIDSHSPTSALRDFMRGTDLARVPEELIKPYEREGLASGELVFQPSSEESDGKAT
jgi:hypothetical protein